MVFATCLCFCASLGALPLFVLCSFFVFVHVSRLGVRVRPDRRRVEAARVSSCMEPYPSKRRAHSVVCTRRHSQR